MFTTLILFSIIICVVFISISGFGKLFLNLSNLNIKLINDFKSLEFIFGLIVVGSFAIILNFFTNINDIITSFIMLLGVSVYFFFFLKNNNKKNEIFLILFLIVASLFFSFYSISNDDFDYHFKTIINFKELDVFKIIHERRISYNSHWLLINAAYYLKFYPVSVFCITSLLYNLIVFDFYFSLKRSFYNSNFLPAIYSFLALVFLIGVINQFKEFGTDFPGQLILLCIFLIYFENNKQIIENNEYKIFVILVLISLFAFTIKISNGLIFIFLLFIFFQMQRKTLLFFFCLPCILPASLWFLQNFIITECLIWPVSFTCFDNVNEAEKEMLIIERFAKGDETQVFDNFNWVSLWLRNHFPKILEIYALYFILLTISPFIYILKNRGQKSKPLLDSSSDLYRLEISNPYFIFAIISILCSIIWFIYSPAYRFGIIYNLNLLIIFLIPAWHSMFIQGKKFFERSLKVFISISLVFFVFDNTQKYQKYIERHGTKWPNIVENNYYYKKGLIN